MKHEFEDSAGNVVSLDSIKARQKRIVSKLPDDISDAVEDEFESMMETIETLLRGMQES